MWSERDYGNRVGVFRIMETLDRYGIRGTVALNSDLCAEHPRDHGGGREAQVGVDGPQREQHPPPQRGRAGRGGADHPPHARDHREGAPATRPEGWLGSGLQETWDTLDHLAANGGEYVADWCNDDQPYMMTPRRRAHHRRDALHPAAQRQVGDRAALSSSADGFAQDDLRPVRRALQARARNPAASWRSRCIPT